MEKIMLVDGNAIINRAFYGIPILTNQAGDYTNGVYGFLSILFRQLDEENPDYLVVTFDLPKPTFRHEAYPEYKGNRKSMPEELRPQLPLLKNLLGLMGVAVCELEGYEADDLLGTLSLIACKSNVDPVIVTGDRDLLQLASETVTVKLTRTKSGKTESEAFRSSDVLEKYGVTPSQYVDVKALMGDASDNIPGVPGIGEKTALKIITEYGSLANAIERSTEIKPARASENLAANRELALLSKNLATIVTDAPVELDLTETRAPKSYGAEARAEIIRLEFKSLLSRFPEEAGACLAEPQGGEIISSYEGASRFAGMLSVLPACAVEFAAEGESVYGIGFAWEEGTAYVSVEKGRETEYLSLFRDFFEGGVTKAAYDSKSLRSLLAAHGIGLANAGFDAGLAAYLLYSSRPADGCHEIAFDFLNETIRSKDDFYGKGRDRKTPGKMQEAEVSAFVSKQSDVILKSMPAMRAALDANGQTDLYYDIELPLAEVLCEMERHGIAIDRDALLMYGRELDVYCARLTGEIYGLCGEEFNINSPAQLGGVLFEKLKLKSDRKTKQGYSTAADVLEKLEGEHPVVGKILEYRTYTKLKGTYVDGFINILDETANIAHTSFNQTGTSTGRLSSADPNLQNIPVRTELGRALRKVFVPTEAGHVFIDADYSQIELRILAHVSEDGALVKAFREGEDIHRLTASQVLGIPPGEVTDAQRSGAKAVNFGIIYGIGAFSLSRDIGVSVKEADEYMKGYFEKYPGVKKYLENAVAEAKKNGYSRTLLGRRRRIPELGSSNFQTRSFGERVAMNMPIQGSAADIIKIAMVRVRNRLRRENPESELVLQVHDELLVEARESDADAVSLILKEEMEGAMELMAPLSADVHMGKTWYDAK